jgi:hypothetical protein
MLLVAALTLLLLVHWPIGLAHSQDRLARHPIATTAAARASLTIEPQYPGRTFAPGAVGLSIEADELATRDLSATHSSLVTLMRLLGPGVLRLGGNSLDYSWWTSSGEPSPAWAKTVLGPQDLTALSELLAATGWRAILGVELSRFDPTRAANEAQAAKQVLGSRLLGIELGNEPNAYANGYLRPRSYGASNYLEDVSAYTAAIRRAVPNVRLYGPDLSSHATWLPAIASAKNAPFAELTQHYYPTAYSVTEGTCKGTTVPTAAELLSPQVRERENAMLKALVQAGQRAHRKTRISETNTTGSCDRSGGPATSPVFASALWSLDWALRAAKSGVAALNFHGYFGRCEPNVSSPICAPGDAAEAHGQVGARPEFFGLLAARQLEGGRFVPVRIRGLTPAAAITAYATRRSNGTVTLAIDDLEATVPTLLHLRLSGYRQASSESLVAPSLAATGDVSFGRASLSAVETPRLTATAVPKSGSGFNVLLAPASAIVVTFHR